MIKNATFGQFYKMESFLHGMDARTKLVGTLFLVMLFLSSRELVPAVMSLGFTFIVIFASGIPLLMYLRNLKAIIPVIIFTSVMNIFYFSGKSILFEFWFIKISAEGLLFSFIIIIRILSAIELSAALTYTTSPTDLTDALERLLSPLTRIKIDIHSLAMMMTIALRFVPTLIEETDKIMSAQKARGAALDSGGIMKRVKAMVPVLIPLFISSFRRAYDLAFAMECRCYTGGKGRTKMKILKAGKRDLAAVCIMAAFSVVYVFAAFIV